MGGRSRTAFGGRRLRRVRGGHTSSRSEGGVQGAPFPPMTDIILGNHFRFMKTPDSNLGTLITMLFCESKPQLTISQSFRKLHHLKSNSFGLHGTPKDSQGEGTPETWWVGSDPVSPGVLNEAWGGGCCSEERNIFPNCDQITNRTGASGDRGTCGVCSSPLSNPRPCPPPTLSGDRAFRNHHFCVLSFSSLCAPISHPCPTHDL